MKRQPRTYGRRYPWKRWFARGAFTLRRPTDYVCMPHGMAQMVRNVASRFGLRVSVRILEGGTILVKVRSGEVV